MRRGRCWLVLPVFLLLQLHLHAAAGYDVDPDRKYAAKKGYSDSYAPPHHGPECEPGFGFKPRTQDRDYYDNDKGTCEPCDPGFYAPGGFAPCRPCGTPNYGFTTPNGAHKPDQCFCKPGTGGVGCTQCPMGTYSTGGTKDEPRAACILCSNGALSIPGATSAAACGCLPGRGGEKCGICPEGQYGPGGVGDDGQPQDCLDCPSNQTTLYPGAKSADQCVCNQGHAGPFCEACSRDQICPGGSKEDPTRCPANSVSPPGEGVFSVRDCVCKPGYGRPADSLAVAECKECPLCELCPAGTYNNNGTETCKPCPLGKTSPPGSDDMEEDCTECPSGFYLEGGTCHECPTGSTSAEGSVGRESCNLCRSGFGLQPCPGTKDGSCTSCQACPAGTYGEGGIGACLPCGPGQTSPPGSTNSTACINCSYTEYEKNGLCLKCPIGNFASDLSGRGPAACRVCATGYGAQPGVGSKDGGACQVCPAGTYGPGGSDAACVPCAPGQTSPPGSTEELRCTNCTFNEYEENGICVQCPVGSYTTNKGRGRAACNSCNAGYGFQPCPGTKEGSCISCQPCPAGTFSAGGFNAVCLPCSPGKTSPPGTTAETGCANCTASEYEENGICLRCPLGSISGDGSGSGRAACHLCVPGYSPQPCPGNKDGSCIFCQPCPVGSYQDGYGDAGCKLCPEGTTTGSVAATKSDACVCKPGFGYNPAAKVRVCNECPVGSYSNVGTQGVCSECPEGMTTLKPGATTSTDCVCKVGHGRDVTGTDEGGCDACVYPFYQGVLNQNLQPVTTATLENPRPFCLKCSSSSLTYMVIGDPQRKCVDSGGTKGSYCVNNPIYTNIELPQNQPACTT